MRWTVSRIWIGRWQAVGIRMSRLRRLAHVGWRTRVIVIGGVSGVLAGRLVSSSEIGCCENSLNENLPHTVDVEEGSVLARGDAMMVREGIDLPVSGHSDIVQVPWDHPDTDLIDEDLARCNHCGRPQVVEAVSLQRDSSFPVAGHSAGEEDMRSDGRLLPSSCSCIIRKLLEAE